MLRTIRVFCFLSLFYLVAQGQSPDLKFKNITDQQGLSNSSVQCILQDYRGFLWVGTLDGLNRYDGNTFIQYVHQGNDSTSLSDNTIQCLYEDRAHQLWIGTRKGLNRFNPLTHTFSHYLHSKDPGSISQNTIQAIFQDHEGVLWVGTEGGGLNRWDPVANRFSHILVPDENGSPGHPTVNTLTEDKKGRLWIGTHGGLALFNRKQNSFTPISLTPMPDPEKLGKEILKIKSDTGGNLWILVKDQGLWKFNPETRSSQSFHHKEEANSLGSDILRDICLDHTGKLWVGGVNAGLNIWNPKNQNFYHYHHEPDNPFSLSQKSVQCIYEDRQHNIWIGTLRGGLNLYTPELGRFKLFKQTASPNSLSYDDIRAFAQDKLGRIWVGVDGGGLDLFDETSGTFRHFRHDPHQENSLCSTAILSLNPDPSGNIWISTWGGGLDLFNPNTQAFHHYKQDPRNPLSINSNFVRKVFQDSQHRIWVATDQGGLNIFHPDKDSFGRFYGNYKGSDHIWGNNIIDIQEDHAQNLWILTLDSGINRYAYGSGKITHFREPSGEPSTDIAFSYTDSKNRFWVGRKGLYLFDPTKDQFRLYTQVAGLDREYIKGILEDDQKNLWMSTSNGIIKFNPDTYAYKKYNMGDGLQGLEFEVNSCLKAKNGELFFGGVNGFNVFYPGDLKTNPIPPPVYLTDFQILNKSVQPQEKNSPLSQDISFTREIHLDYSQSTFSFVFAALNYVVPENNQYAYRLENFDKNWVQGGSEHKATYTNISPGDYTFQVKASNNDGLWNEKPTEVKIIISPPFYLSGWFKILALGILFLAAYTILYFRRAFELRILEEKKNQELQQVQLQFFTNISHEFRTPLSLILGPLEKINYETSAEKISHYYHTISRNAHRLMSLINELMDFRKVETGALKLRVQKENLILFLEEIIEEFKDLSTLKSIQFHYQNPEKFEQTWFDHSLVEKIVLNLVNNAFKYTNDQGRIEVALRKDLDAYVPAYSNELSIKNPKRFKNYFYILVKDNGIGITRESLPFLFERYYRISSSHLGSGVGLAFVKSLTLLHKGDIFVFSERNLGTEIIIALPYGEENYSQEEKTIIGTQEPGIRLESEFQVSRESLIPMADQKEESQNKAHILLVDDNQELRNFLKEELETRYTVQEAENGISALEFLQSDTVDLIISDIMMPGMNGIDFCQAVREQVEISHIPFILLTAKDSVESQMEGAKSGADIYLSKPINLGLLQLTIKNIFEKQEKLRDHYVKDSFVEARGLVHSAKDKEFMDRLMQIIDSQLVNPELDVDYLCREIYMSKTKLYQKIKSITGQSIAEFVRTYRLKKAVQMMTHEDVLLSEVTQRLGFVDPSYFSRVFKKEYGKTPSQFLQEIKKGIK